MGMLGDYDLEDEYIYAMDVHNDRVIMYFEEDITDLILTKRDVVQLAKHFNLIEGETPAALNLIEHIQRQIAWSSATFGTDRRTKGLIDHIKKELVEIEEKPDDLEEWIDVVILGFDGAWRAGYTAPDIAEALVTKQSKNECRAWPNLDETSPDKAIEHIK